MMGHEASGLSGCCSTFRAVTRSSRLMPAVGHFLIRPLVFLRQQSSCRRMPSGCRLAASASAVVVNRTTPTVSVSITAVREVLKGWDLPHSETSISPVAFMHGQISRRVKMPLSHVLVASSLITMQGSHPRQSPAPSCLMLDDATAVHTHIFLSIHSERLQDARMVSRRARL